MSIYIDLSQKRSFKIKLDFSFILFIRVFINYLRLNYTIERVKRWLVDYSFEKGRLFRVRCLLLSFSYWFCQILIWSKAGLHLNNCFKQYFWSLILLFCFRRRWGFSSLTVTLCLIIKVKLRLNSMLNELLNFFILSTLLFFNVLILGLDELNDSFEILNFRFRVLVR